MNLVPAARRGVRRVLPLLLGWEELPKSVSVHGASREERIREPVPGVLLECEDGWLLLDTGFNTALLRDPALRRRFYPSPAYRPVLPGPGEPLEEALDAVGVALADVTAVAVSHLHADHAGGLKHFAGQVPVHVQCAELAYGLSGRPEVERHTVFRVDFDDPRIDWRQADGDTEIAPGVTAVLTAGHTPGHVGILLTLHSGRRLLLAGDAVWNSTQLKLVRQRPALARVADADPEAAYRTIVRLSKVPADVTVLPAHDHALITATFPGGGWLE